MRSAVIVTSLLLSILMIFTANAHDPFLKLPFKVEVTESGITFSITNRGEGSAAEFRTSNVRNRNATLIAHTDGAGPAIRVRTEGFGTGIEALSRGTGPAANFRIDNPANESPVIEISTNGKGPAARFTGDIVLNGEILREVPIGTVLPFYGDLSRLPNGWLPCDGRAVNEPKFPFKNVPDLRSMF